ncbi:MAG: hypothetical protein LIO76_10495 [Clostridiales bacterium]|nr:hypothetical protein [Clostridiales bacterium]
MNPKKYPHYDAERILKNLADAAASGYKEKKTLRQIAIDLDMNPIKVRKLLITAGVYQSDIADKVKELRAAGKKENEIMEMLNLSRASVNSYLPYKKAPYKAQELSANAERLRKYRERKSACERLAEESSLDNLWNCIEAFQRYPFYTAKGQKYTYEVHGSKMKLNDKTVDRATVEMAYRKAVAGEIDKEDYLSPVFVRFGVAR